MSRSFRRAQLVLLGLAIAPAAWPCGPEFDTDYVFRTRLDAADDTLFGLERGLFDFGVAGSRLAPDGSWQEDERLAWEPSGAVSTEAQEKAELGDRYPLVQSMRAAKDEATGWQAGEGLPLEIRHYVAGARAFKAGELELARRHFESVLALPARARSQRTLWAQFMLGRVALAAARAHDGRERARQATVAMKAFEKLRSLAVGQSDPQQLVKGSLGEEAAAAMLVGDYARAARRYEQQAEAGSTSGKVSLSFLANHLLSDSERMQVAMRDPLLQRLVSAYLRTSGFATKEVDFRTSYGSAGATQRYFAALSTMPGASVVGADQFAAQAYQLGNFELAERLLENSSSPLAEWLRAKLALRRGDRATAKAGFAAAAQSFRTHLDWGFEVPASERPEAYTPRCRVDLDRAVLAEQDGAHAEALELLRHAVYFRSETLQLAESRFSVDELKEHIDAFDDGDDETLRDIDRDLRQLLGRRLFREQRFSEAVHYFEGGPLEDAARRYADAMRRAASTEGAARAAALYEIAVVLQEDGYDLLDPYPEIEGFRGAGYRFRRIAADYANQAADHLPRHSQAFAAVLCSATGWLLAREPEAARVYYQRYVHQGAFFDWAGNFGQQCPEPQFEPAKRVAH